MQGGCSLDESPVAAMKISSWRVTQHSGLDRVERDRIGPSLGHCSLDGHLWAEPNRSGWVTEKSLALDVYLRRVIRISNVQDTIARAILGIGLDC